MRDSFKVVDKNVKICCGIDEVVINVTDIVGFVV